MPIKILVVDDEEEVAELLDLRFRHKIREGAYQFRFATSGQAALAAMQAEPDIDVLLLDINMPDIDGLTLLGRLPALMPHSRAVIVSAYGDMPNIRTAMNRGAFDFICKPINFTDLDTTIEKTADHVRHLRDSAQVKLLADLKTHFFDNITHEFRTPLTLILAPTAGLLQAANLPETARHDLLTIERNARHLLHLINQLLELARLEVGQVRVETQVGLLNDYVQELVDSFQPLARQQDVQLSYRSTLSGKWRYDAEKVARIVYNLLSNAFKFMPAPPVPAPRPRQVAVSLAAENTVHLTVADTGPGIAPESLPRIFDRFYQGAPGSGQLPGGAGIGLALVQELTSLMGGKVAVQSSTTAPSGTTFLVELPLLPAEHEPVTDASAATLLEQVEPSCLPQPPAPAVRPKAAEVPLLLLLDDNEELRTYLARQLAAEYRVLTAANGEEGWLLVQQELPDVVVSDVMMPVLDGYELTDRIKTTPATDHVAVVLLTAKATHDQRMTGLRQGADDYLTKPFHLDELLVRLRNLLARQQRLRQLYAGQLASPGPAPEAPENVQSNWLRGLYAVLEKHLDDPGLNVEWLAEQMMMSRKTLLRKVQSLTQLAPSELIQQYRLRKAAELLRAGHTVSETAYIVGFNTPAYFGQCFKELYHITPSEFIATGSAQSAAVSHTLD
ncbi:response regulator [Hymenobacter lutimineralis]|uniref:histidine kinase n=1 Tax=Hymenobacter lutimineralis TaxID=2606448 RepID=A0A5D6UXW9_9BACT|nr:response regulator [Hymenobacter lutimineralis]TYZ08403.1 response regulator [Hymenobacter lutimineralis]